MHVIATLSDIHVRQASRHEEYRIVFKKTLRSLRKLKPDYIVNCGDLVHQKLQLGPDQISLVR